MHIYECAENHHPQCTLPEETHKAQRSAIVLAHKTCILFKLWYFRIMSLTVGDSSFVFFNHEGEISLLCCFACCDTRICSWTAINVECSRPQNPADKHSKTSWCTLMGLLSCRHGEHGLVRCGLLLLDQNKCLHIDRLQDIALCYWV